jgi:hypothetical protein
MIKLLVGIYVSWIISFGVGLIIYILVFFGRENVENFLWDKSPLWLYSSFMSIFSISLSKHQMANRAFCRLDCKNES